MKKRTITTDCKSETRATSRQKRTNIQKFTTCTTDFSDKIEAISVKPTDMRSSSTSDAASSNDTDMRSSSASGVSSLLFEHINPPYVTPKRQLTHTEKEETEKKQINEIDDPELVQLMQFMGTMAIRTEKFQPISPPK